MNNRYDIPGLLRRALAHYSVPIGPHPSTRLLLGEYGLWPTGAPVEPGQTLPLILAGWYWLQESLARLGPFDHRRRFVQAQLDATTGQLAEFMADYLLVSCMAESRHLPEIGYGCVKCASIVPHIGTARHSASVGMWTKFDSRYSALDLMNHTFIAHKWSQSVGGPKWGWLAYLCLKLHVALAEADKSEVLQILDMICYSHHAGGNFMTARFTWAGAIFGSVAVLNILHYKQVGNPCAWWRANSRSTYWQSRDPVTDQLRGSYLVSRIRPEFQIIRILEPSCKLSMANSRCEHIDDSSPEDKSVPPWQRGFVDLVTEGWKCSNCGLGTKPGSKYCANWCPYCVACRPPQGALQHRHRCWWCNYQFPNQLNDGRCPKWCERCGVCLAQTGYHYKCHWCPTMSILELGRAKFHETCIKCGAKDLFCLTLNLCLWCKRKTLATAEPPRPKSKNVSRSKKKGVVNAKLLVPAVESYPPPGSGPLTKDEIIANAKSFTQFAGDSPQPGASLNELYELWLKSKPSSTGLAYTELGPKLNELYEVFKGLPTPSGLVTGLKIPNPIGEPIYVKIPGKPIINNPNPVYTYASSEPLGGIGKFTVTPDNFFYHTDGPPGPSKPSAAESAVSETVE